MSQSDSRGADDSEKENIAPAAASLIELNPSFTIYTLPLEEQFAQIEGEFSVLELTTMDPRAYSFNCSLQNNLKNRYFNVMANDQTIFPPKKSSRSDVGPLYINGNLVDLGVSPTFVACQAPTPVCTPDFLTTLCTQKISLVVMLTSIVENNMIKADRYWPDDDCENGVVEVFGAVRVWKDAQDPYTFNQELRIITRPFFVRYSDDAPTHKVVQMQYIDWPDHGVPKTTEPFDALLKVISGYRTDWGNGETAEEPPPVVVHCSAGIGRTGTLIGAYAALQMLQRGSVPPDFMRDLVFRMRSCRFGMVQRVEQYMFMYQIVLRHMGCDVRGFSTMLQRMADAFQMRLQMSRQAAANPSRCC